jgi:A/G-specific adenine glycosylase
MPLAPEQIRHFRRQLLVWYGRAKRDLPWRRNRDPYSVFVSEVMLQQTRVTAVISYYERFISRFPDFHALAGALEADLLSHWAGLGYYYRARNLQKAAQSMSRAGAFPSTHEGILALPGVGGYTAAAVASISFNLPYAVVDGNVYRVLSRVANDCTDIASSAGKKRFAALAETLLDRTSPGDHNQALMELGATVCLPKNPQCLICPVSDLCLARAAGTQNQLPVKRKRQRSIEIQRTLYWIEDRGRLLLWQRPADSSLMPGFWELPEPAQLPGVTPGESLGAFRHGITIYNYRFELIRAAAPPAMPPCQWVGLTNLPGLPLSSIVRKAQRIIAKSAARPSAATA